MTLLGARPLKVMKQSEYNARSSFNHNNIYYVYLDRRDILIQYTT